MRILLMLALMFSFSVSAFAQRNTSGDKKAFEEAQARTLEPFHAAYVIPVVYDVDVSPRQEFGPYAFELKGEIEKELPGFKNRAIYYAMTEVGADELIGTIFDSYVIYGDSKTAYVKLSAYPCKWKNFRNLDSNSKDLDLIKQMYPSAPVTISFDRATTSIEGKENKGGK